MAKRDIMIPPQGGMIRNSILRVKLILRLIRDKRVSPWLKILPLAGVFYLITPMSIIPDITLPVIGELDDAAVLWLTSALFVELCPDEIVQEHMRALSSNGKPATNDEDIVDAESVEIKEKKK